MLEEAIQDLPQQRRAVARQIVEDVDHSFLRNPIGKEVKARLLQLLEAGLVPSLDRLHDLSFGLGPAI